ncbi:hypothetical protein KC330_g168 [Hortaea werneckii]|nr:hypothetical protein KC330_g168 [Hortaea werneckii]
MFELLSWGPSTSSDWSSEVLPREQQDTSFPVLTRKFVIPSPRVAEVWVQHNSLLEPPICLLQFPLAPEYPRRRDEEDGIVVGFLDGFQNARFALSSGFQMPDSLAPYKARVGRIQSTARGCLWPPNQPERYASRASSRAGVEGFACLRPSLTRANASSLDLLICLSNATLLIHTLSVPASPLASASKARAFSVSPFSASNFTAASQISSFPGFAWKARPRTFLASSISPACHFSLAKDPDCVRIYGSSRFVTSAVRARLCIVEPDLLPVIVFVQAPAQSLADYGLANSRARDLTPRSITLATICVCPVCSCNLAAAIQISKEAGTAFRALFRTFCASSGLSNLASASQSSTDRGMISVAFANMSFASLGSSSRLTASFQIATDWGMWSSAFRSTRFFARG